MSQHENSWWTLAHDFIVIVIPGIFALLAIWLRRIHHIVNSRYDKLLEANAVLAEEVKRLTKKVSKK